MSPKVARRETDPRSSTLAPGIILPATTHDGKDVGISCTLAWFQDALDQMMDQPLDALKESQDTLEKKQKETDVARKLIDTLMAQRPAIADMQQKLDTNAAEIQALKHEIEDLKNKERGPTSTIQQLREDIDRVISNLEERFQNGKQQGSEGEDALARPSGLDEDRVENEDRIEQATKALQSTEPAPKQDAEEFLMVEEVEDKEKGSLPGPEDGRNGMSWCMILESVNEGNLIEDGWWVDIVFQEIN